MNTARCGRTRRPHPSRCASPTRAAPTAVAGVAGERLLSVQGHERRQAARLSPFEACPLPMWGHGGHGWADATPAWVSRRWARCVCASPRPWCDNVGDARTTAAQGGLILYIVAITVALFSELIAPFRDGARLALTVGAKRVKLELQRYRYQIRKRARECRAAPRNVARLA